MRFSPTRLSGPLLAEPVVHGDARGFFVETFRLDLIDALGGQIPAFVQDNQSRSRRGVLRGMHYQAGQSKLVRCTRGEIFDVIVDVRVGSPQFGQWEGFRLDDQSHHQLYVPDGFAHGFCVLSEQADVVYKVSSYYDPSREAGFAYDDPAVAISWPTGVELLVSDRDRAAPSLASVTPGLPFRFVSE